MDAIRIANLRSLEDTGFIDLKPITILVGQNSSGKSTFLRTFPLFRQSVEERTTGPILWYGRYVDFGSFSESVNANAKSKDISFGFQFLITPEIKRYTSYDRARRGKDRNKTSHVEAVITIQNHRIKEDGYVSSIELLVDRTDHFCISITPDGVVSALLINGKNFAKAISGSHISMNTLFPVIRFEGKLDLKEVLNERVVNEVLKNEKITEAKRYNLMGLYNAISHVSFEELELYSDSSPDDFGTENVLTLLNDLKIRLTPDHAEQIQSFIQLSRLTRLLREVQYYVSSFSKTCTYIAPVRATAERFYRPQNLSVDDVDFQGKNLAVFLRSLSSTEMKEFNKWTEKHFNFTAHVLVSGGHLSIVIKDGGVENNLADTGFGYSQVLPVITQLWSLVTSKHNRRSIPITYSIEQPELHLHPRMQAKLADALVDAIQMSTRERIKLRLIVETHSEAIVNRLGHRIAHGDIVPELINVVIFDKTKSDEPTSVSVGKFDKDGFLTNWPYGFFEPEFEE